MTFKLLSEPALPTCHRLRCPTLPDRTCQELAPKIKSKPFSSAHSVLPHNTVGVDVDLDIDIRGQLNLRCFTLGTFSSLGLGDGEPRSGLDYLPRFLRFSSHPPCYVIRRRPPILGLRSPASEGEVTCPIGEEIRPTGKDTRLIGEAMRAETGD